MPAHFNPTGSATVVVIPSAGDETPTWTLTGTRGTPPYSHSGSGMEPLSNMDPDTYTLTWDPLPQWHSPDPAVDVQFVPHEGTIMFSGVYTPWQGSVEIVPQPEGLEAPWTLDGASGTHEEGVGYALLEDLGMDTYTLTWGEMEYWFSPDPDVETRTLDTAGGTIVFTGAYHTAIPTDITVTDVPNDQGRHVRIEWSGCEFDQPGSTLHITGYEIYRRQDAYKGAYYEPPKVVTGRPSNADKLDGWDFIGTVPAHGDAVYQYVALTLCDWTEEADCPTTFFMRVTTDDNFVYYDSPEFSGSSIDNLVPGVPKSLLISYNADANVLSWDEPGDPDVAYFKIYRAEWDGGDPPAFPGGDAYALEAGLGWTDPLVAKTAWDWYYFVTAVDFNGNESEPTGAADTALSGVNDPSLPQRVVLHPVYPNPFNPSTTIRFELPEPASVRLEIYDVSGRRIRVLREGEAYVPGRYDVIWDGRSEDGAIAAAGVYFGRLRAAGMEMTRRMTLLK